MTDKFDTADIAEYLGLKRPYVTDNIVKREDFPRPIINRGPRLRRWNADDVIRWAAGDQSRDAMSSDVAL